MKKNLYIELVYKILFIIMQVIKTKHNLKLSIGCALADRRKVTLKAITKNCLRDFNHKLGNQ